MSIKNYVAATILGLASGVNLACGLYSIARGYSVQDSARDAVYAKAEEITPQVMEQANRAGNKNGNNEFYLSIFSFGIAGVCGFGALQKATEREKKEE